MPQLNDRFHHRLALARLDSGTVDLRPWPRELEEAAGELIPGGVLAAALLLELHPGSLVLAAGPLTGASVPGGCLATASLAGADGAPRHVPLLLRHGPALKASGVDFLVLTGRAAAPVLLTAASGGFRLEGAAKLAGLDVPATRLALRSRFPDTRASLLLAGPAAIGAPTLASAGLEAGQGLDRGDVAAWMAVHNLAAVALAGGGPLPGSGSRNEELFAAVGSAGPKELGAAGFLEVLGWLPGADQARELAPKVLGRAAACHFCPRPCLAYLQAGPGRNGLLCADHAGFAAMAQALGPQAPRGLAACARHGLDPVALAPHLAPLLASSTGKDGPGNPFDAYCAELASGRSPLPETARGPAPLSGPCPVPPGGGQRALAGMILGVCPILMEQTSGVPLELWTAGTTTGQGREGAARLESSLARMRP